MLPSFEERSVWVQLVSLLVVMGGYLLAAGWMMARGMHSVAGYVATFLVASGLLVVVLILGHIVAAVVGKPEKPDERDRIIGWRAEAHSSWLLGVGVLAGVGLLALGVPTVWAVHTLLLSLFGSEVLRLALQALYYRRGI
ncbi:MAG: hypothetical protein ACTS3F_03190 [Phycisphaerales bacterium]